MPYQALATGPISFLDANASQQEIPLSAIYFDADGPNASSWPNYSKNTALIKALLAQLAAQGLLTPGTQTAPTPALSITATQNGPIGNDIQVTFSNVTATTMSVQVVATQVYPGLTTTTIETVLGTTAASAPGLVYVQSNNDQPPATVWPAVPIGASLAVAQAANSADTAFVLAPANAAEEANITISVVPDPLPATTFSVTAIWQSSANGLTPAALINGATNPFALFVSFTGPADGPLPAPGTVALQGGAAATSSPAVPATATVLSS